MPSYVCPGCGARGMSVFYELEGIPVHSVILLPTRADALDYPTGDVALGFCRNCGSISNVAFEPGVQEYSPRYESTQSFSPTFNVFAQGLAMSLIDRYDLHGKDIIEIGCGQGEFLTMLCELGGNRGVGFDPAYVGGGSEGEGNDQIRFIKDFYSEAYLDYRSDFVCCKMTLEHIQETADFVSVVRRSLGGQFETIVFFQVPDVTRILRELAFWDIYYEHCSYFSMGSLARLFRRCEFEVIDLWRDYDDQYLMIEARLGRNHPTEPLPREEDPAELARDVASFSDNYREKLEKWQHDLRQMRQSGRRVVIWGASSKGVAFLTTLGVRTEIAYAVDINPRKHGTYTAGTGQEIVPPSFLREYAPDTVIVMNPIYRKEIWGELNRMGLAPELIMV